MAWQYTGGAPRAQTAWIYRDFEGLAGGHQREGIGHGGEPHLVGDQRVRHQGLGLQELDGLADQLRGVVESPHQRQLLIVRASRIHLDRRSGGATAEEDDGAAPTDGLQRPLPDFRAPGGIHHHVRAASARARAQRGGEVARLARVQRLRDAGRAHPLEPPATLAHQQHPRLALGGGQREEAAERTMAEHGHRHSRLHAPALDPVQRAGQRLREGGAPRRQGGADAHEVLVHEPRRQGEVLAVGAVDEEEILAEIRPPRAAGRAAAAGRGVGGHQPVPLAPAVHAGSDRGDGARHLVTEDGGDDGDHHGMAAAEHLHVGAAGERGLHPDDHFPRRRRRHGQLLQPKVAGAVKHLSPHARAHGVT